MMYESPITIYQSPEYRRLSESVDTLVIEECRKVGVVVNKEELVKALQHDRNQYEKGYKDALKERGIICCKDCKHHWTHKCMDSMPIERCDLEQTFYDAEIDFCSLAERTDK